MPNPGSVIELSIEKPAAGGRMVARLDGQVVLVHAAIPGERVRAVVERTGQGVVYATAIDLVEASPDRRAGVTDWACGGSVYAHVAYPRQLSLKGEVIADALARIGKIVLDGPVAVAASPERGYRMRARFHVRGRMIGYFREGTHGMCDPVTTGQLLPGTGELVGLLAERAGAGRLDGVSEVELAENVEATERAFHLELGRPSTPQALSEIAAMPTVVGASASFGGPGRGGRGSVRRSIAAGERSWVVDTLSLPSSDSTRTVTLRHHARAFFQGNRFLLASLAGRVVSLVAPGPVVDLYAGVGLFSVALAGSGRSPVVAVEGDPAGAADLAANASPYRGALEAVEMSVEDYLVSRPVPAEATIVLDPPRTGMSKAATAAVVGQRARRLVYVSCDVATFARDARKLLDAGYRLEHLEAFDLFPNTAHVETVGLFAR